MQTELFGQQDPQQFSQAGFYLPEFIGNSAGAVIDEVRACVRQSPLRHFRTPGGGTMSVLSSNCGDYGWVSDSQGYRYQTTDPKTMQPWPAMPTRLKVLARQAATQCGFHSFDPDVCLINVYRPKAKMGLHRDNDESDFSQPIVSFSLGIPATFLWGGLKRQDKPLHIDLKHGDGLVWGDADRLRYHGIKTLSESHHPATGDVRINLTFRKR